MTQYGYYINIFLHFERLIINRINSLNKNISAICVVMDLISQDMIIQYSVSVFCSDYLVSHSYFKSCNIFVL